MSDIYLFLTPILTLLVVGLVGFVGCDALFGLDEVTYDPPIPPILEEPTVDNMRVDLTWIPPTAGTPTRYEIEKGTAPGNRPLKKDVGLATSYSDPDVMNGSTYYYAVTSFVGGTARGTSNEVSAVPGYTGLRSLITGVTPGTLRNDFTGNVGFGFQVAGTAIIVSRLGRMKLPGNAGTHSLKLVDASTQTDIQGGSVTINLAGAPDNAFAYGDLPAPITLNPGAEYYVLSSESGMGDQWYDAADTRVMTTTAVTRVFAVNGDGAGNYSRAPVNEFVYGPLDLQY